MTDGVVALLKAVGDVCHVTTQKEHHVAEHAAKVLRKNVLGSLFVGDGHANVVDRWVACSLSCQVIATENGVVLLLILLAVVVLKLTGQIVVGN